MGIEEVGGDYQKPACPNILKGGYMNQILAPDCIH